MVDWYSSPAGGGLLLDDYPNAAAAYSLRLVRTAYTGDCIEVRRASDNALDTIGFAGGVLDTASLKTFCASTDCFVRTWYDQSTNANNLTQTTNANQPQIVSSGAVLREGTQPAILFDGASDFMTATASASLSFTNGTTDTPLSAFLAFRLLTQSSNDVIFAKDNGTPNREYAWGYFNESEARFFLKEKGGNPQISRDNKDAGQLNLYQIGAMIYDGGGANTDIQFYMNTATSTMGDAITTTYTSMSVTSAPFTVGNYGASTAPANFDLQELVLWGIDQTSNRSAIESNMNAFYSVY